MTTAPTTPSNSGKAQINVVAIKRSDVTSHSCGDHERLMGLGRTDMNLSPDLDGCHAQFGHACDSRTIDAWNDPQLDRLYTRERDRDVGQPLLSGGGWACRAQAFDSGKNRVGDVTLACLPAPSD